MLWCIYGKREEWGEREGCYYRRWGREKGEEIEGGREKERKGGEKENGSRVERERERERGGGGGGGGGEGEKETEREVWKGGI